MTHYYMDDNGEVWEVPDQSLDYNPNVDKTTGQWSKHISPPVPNATPSTPSPGSVLISHGGYSDRSISHARMEKIDQIIQESYDGVIARFNANMSEGSHPVSGLKSLEYVPFSEKIDGAAKMVCPPGIVGAGASGGGGTYSETSYDRNGSSIRRALSQSEIRDQILNTLWERGVVAVYTWDRHWVRTKDLSTRQLIELLERSYSNKSWLTCAELFIVGLVAVALIIFMMLAS